MSLATLVEAFLTKLDLYAALDLDPPLVEAYFNRVQQCYKAVPYHNHLHVASVVALCCDIWLEKGLGDKVKLAVPHEHNVLALAFVTAAATHDIEHQGLSNEWLVRTCHPYAVAHNDVSPNESHHASTAFRILFNECNFVAGFSGNDMRCFRKATIDLIMASDMKRHFEIQSNLRNRDMRHLASQDVPVLMQAAFKSADLGHTLLPFQDHMAWSQLLQEETHAEGDLWRSKGWSVQALMDRNRASSFSENQSGFFQYVVVPFLEILTDALPAMAEFLAQAKSNEEAWRRMSPSSNP